MFGVLETPTGGTQMDSTGGITGDWPTDTKTGKELNFAQKQAAEAGRAMGAPVLGKRPSKDKNFLDIADLVAQRSNCRRRHFGAVVVSDGQVISTGYNG